MELKNQQYLEVLLVIMVFQNMFVLNLTLKLRLALRLKMNLF